MSIMKMPVVTDEEFAHGMGVIPPPPARVDDGSDAWLEVARHLVDRGLGQYPIVFPQPGVDLHDALRFTGAMMATSVPEHKEERIAGWLKAMFAALQPEGGPEATASRVSEV